MLRPVRAFLVPILGRIVHTLIVALNKFSALLAVAWLIYGDEISNLDVRKEFFRSFGTPTLNYAKCIFDNYFLRGFSIASVELLSGHLGVLFGLVFGISEWFPA
jgi:hypothetical protein